MTKSCYWSLIASQNRIATRRPASRCSCWSKRLGEATDTPGKQLIRHPGWLAESLTLAPSLSESHPAAAWLVGAERHVLPLLPPRYLRLLSRLLARRRLFLHGKVNCFEDRIRCVKSMHEFASDSLPLFRVRIGN